MIAIPNMEKPKFCKDGENICFAWDDEKYKCRVTEWKKPCPLIEIDDDVWENEKYKLIRMTQEARINKAMAERRADEHTD